MIGLVLPFVSIVLFCEQKVMPNNINCSLMCCTEVRLLWYFIVGRVHVFCLCSLVTLKIYLEATDWSTLFSRLGITMNFTILDLQFTFILGFYDSGLFTLDCSN